MLYIVILIVIIEFIYATEELLVAKPRESAPGFKAKAVLDDKFIDISLKDYENKEW